MMGFEIFELNYGNEKIRDRFAPAGPHLNPLDSPPASEAPGEVEASALGEDNCQRAEQHQGVRTVERNGRGLSLWLV